MTHPILELGPILFQFVTNVFQFFRLVFWQKGDFGSIMHIISHILPHHISFGNPRNVFFLWWAHSILVLVRLSAIDFSFAAIDFFLLLFRGILSIESFSFIKIRFCVQSSSRPRICPLNCIIVGSIKLLFLCHRKFEPKYKNSRQKCSKNSQKF